MFALRTLLAALLALAAAPAGAACSVAGTDTDLGTQSPVALKTGATPYLAADGGFGCTSASLLNLLADNFLRATLASNAVLTLTSPAGGTIPITLAAMPDGSAPLRAGQPTTYMGNGLTILSLGGSGAFAARVYVKPGSAALPAPGTYSGQVDVTWDWRFCSGVYAIGLVCVGDFSQGSAPARIKIKLTVGAKPATVQITTETVWGPVSGTRAPKAVPGSKQRVSVTVTNTDIVALDLDTLAIQLPTVAKTAVALDGDGRGGAVVTSAQGSPASGLTLAYAGPADTGDDVDFSSDNGASWTFAPSLATQGAITGVRFRPRGSMAPLSSFTMSIPYSVK